MLDVFEFSPKTDEEIEAIKNQGLLTEGIYPFTVKEVESQVSQSNNPMLKVRLGVLDAKGEERNIIDYLVATDKMMFKLKHFCEAIGIEDKYNSGKFTPKDCLNRSGKAKIGVQKGSMTPDGSGFYPDKNSIKDYLKGVASTPVADVPFNDDIKF